MAQWAKKLRPYIIDRLIEVVRRHGSRLSYFELCEALRKELPGLPEQSVYYLLAALCPGGYAPLEMLTQMASFCDPQPPCVLDLWVLWAFQQTQWREFVIEWKKASGAGSQLSSTDYASLKLPSLRHPDFVVLGMRVCRRVGGSERTRWEVTAAALDPQGTGFVQFQSLRAAVESLGQEWWLAKQVLDILSTLNRSHMSLDGLFEWMDQDQTGQLSANDFELVANHLVGRNLQGHEAEVIFRMFDVHERGVLRREDIVSGLDLVDTWNADFRK